MKVHVSQFYLVPNARYSFSHHWQLALGMALTQRVTPSDYFANRYGADFELMFRISADPELKSTVVKGPTVFAKDKDVEFTIFLPFDDGMQEGLDQCRKVTLLIIAAITEVLNSLKIATADVVRDSPAFVDEILSDPKMTKAPWSKK